VDQAVALEPERQHDLERGAAERIVRTVLEHLDLHAAVLRDGDRADLYAIAQ
jgi:adenylate kinase